MECSCLCSCPVSKEDVWVCDVIGKYELVYWCVLTNCFQLNGPYKNEGSELVR